MTTVLKPESVKRYPGLAGGSLWQTGFRPFFLGAALWAVISMLLWYGLLNLGWKVSLNGMPMTFWHAHEMIYGFSLAVIAGFLLTAVPKWTGTKPVSGLKLSAIVLLWLSPRITGLFGAGNMLLVTATLDMLFIASLLYFVAVPVIAHGQWRQSGILSKIILLGCGNLLFYLGVMGIVENGIHYGLYGGFYLVIALILTMGRRVIPTFVESRFALKQPLRNRRWVDLGSLVLFLIFWGVEVFTPWKQVSMVLALLIGGLLIIRLYDWYFPAIWRDPLVWVLYLAHGFIVIGFGLMGAQLFGTSYSPLLPVHMSAIGGIGLITCGMMARVSLGHTGRNIKRLSLLMTAAFASLALSAIVRVVLPLFYPELYMRWVVVSQWLWIAGFFLFLVVYLPKLSRPRIDGLPG